MASTSKSQIVKLRKKTLKNGGSSLYLEWNSNNKTEKKYLGIHLTNGKSPIEKEEDRKAMAIAVALRNEKELKIIGGEVKTIKVQATDKVTLIAWLETFRDLKAKTGQSKSLSVTANNLTLYIKDFCGGDNVLLRDVNREFCGNFITYLSTTKQFIRNTFKNNSLRGTKTDKPLAKSTAKLYYETFVTALNEAVNRDLIVMNPANKISKSDKKAIKSDSPEREFLTIDELKAMESTFVRNASTKRAFLFSCYTGLRISDIKTLVWNDIKTTKNVDGTEKLYIDKEMIKTRRDIKFPLPLSALSYLPERDPNTPSTSLVFPDLVSEGSMNKMLKTWAKDAGIQKDICFHCARHTFATMLLTKGADLYIVSELLGHQDIRTTRIYAKIVDERIYDTIHLIDTI